MKRFAYTLKKTKKLVKKEKSWNKRLILGTSIAAGIVALIFSSLYLNRFNSAVNFQSMYDAFDSENDVIIYDVACAQYLPTGYYELNVIGDYLDDLESELDDILAGLEDSYGRRRLDHDAQHSLDQALADLEALTSSIDTSILDGIYDSSYYDYDDDYDDDYYYDNDYNSTYGYDSNYDGSATSVPINNTLAPDEPIDYKAIYANVTLGAEAKLFYSDPEEAFKLSIEILEDCGTDEDCLKKGSRWSHVYLANGLLLLLIVVNSCLGCCGAYYPCPRYAGALFSMCLCLSHFGIVIASAVYRFGKQGQLCALSLAPTNAPTDNPVDVDDAWTYEKDAALILGCFVVQLVLCFVFCLVSICPLYRGKKKK